MKRAGKETLGAQAKMFRTEVVKRRQGVSVRTGKYLYVTRVKEHAAGTAQKFPKEGPQETVYTEDLTLDGIRKACANHFKEDWKCCRIFLSKKGIPRCWHSSA